MKWEVKKDFYKVTFRLNNQTMLAYFNEEGEQFALSRNNTVSQLPLALSTALQNKYDEFWLTDLFEFASNGEPAYYATIHNGTRVIILKATVYGGWAVYKRDKRSN